jgi:tetratricopeptide (TPR) repeat protein
MRFHFVLSAIALAMWGVGCATVDTDRPASLAGANSPAWSAKASPPEMIVAVSPAGKSLRVLGSSGAVIGAGADAIVNARFREPIRKALEDYDAAAVYAGIIEEGLERALKREIAEVAALGSTAGMNTRREAQVARYASLAKNGTDVVLDLVMTFGIYGADGTLATRLDGDLVLTREGSTLWENTIVVTTEPVLANAKLGDPTKRMGMTIMNPDLTVDDEKVKRWTADGGAVLKERFEMAARTAVAAVLCDMGIAQDEGSGFYALGKLAMNRKQFREAAQHFDRALQLDPSLIDAANARAVTLALNKQIDDAIAAARRLTESNPEFGPAWFNLAWWYATEKKDVAAAKEAYGRAQALGMPPEKKIERFVGKSE